MNQSILFPDIQSWNADLNAVVFSAQQSGALIECMVTIAELTKLVGRPVNNEQQAMTAFAEMRFDIEDITEELIEDEAFNQWGQIEVRG